MNKNIKSIIASTVVLTLICIVSSSTLAITNRVTKRKIEEAALNKEKITMTRVLQADSYRENTVTFNGNYFRYWKALTDGNEEGCIFSVSEYGYGGPVNVMVGITVEGKISSIEITDASKETPGLGQNVLKKKFTQQFTGKTDDVSVRKKIMWENQVEAVTGATVSSKAVERAVNKAFDLYNAVREADKNAQ